MTLEIKRTDRGFSRAEFTDRYGIKCSIQKSSLATEDAIWLGVDDVKPEITLADAKRLGVPIVGPPDGAAAWVKYPIPQEVVLHDRMHLTKDMVRDLLPLLQNFVATGCLATPAENDENAVAMTKLLDLLAETTEELKKAKTNRANDICFAAKMHRERDKALRERDKALVQLAPLLRARPEAEWHDDDGAALWWRFPVEEPPWVGSPLCTDWEPGYYTHWTPLLVPENGKKS